ncbi:MAG: hypothetical protein AYK18_07050 [Theionarchaea archaeon DG-70]|nr:MAG: hypothetical protein AYK18_07050 [Theionarchaea archaeon DG-70]
MKAKLKPKILLGLFLILLSIGFLTAPLSIQLYIDYDGFWEFEEYYETDRYIYEANSFLNVHYSPNGLKGTGICEKDPTDFNTESGTYAHISYTFTSETPITKATLDISVYSESQQSAVRIYVNDTLLEAFLGEKTIDISEYVKGTQSFSIKLEFWLLNCVYPQDLYIRYFKLIGTSEIPPEPEPSWTPPPEEFSDSEKEEKYYYQLSTYIRDDSNPSLQKAAYRCVHGWLHLIKMLTGVVI